MALLGGSLLKSARWVLFGERRSQSAQDFKFIVFPGAGLSVNQLIDAGKGLAEVFLVSDWFQIHITPRLRRLSRIPDSP